MSRPVLLTGRGGLGDAIYARPFVREAARRFGNVYVETSWPEIFTDLPVKCVKRPRGLALQQYHGDLAPVHLWHKAPRGVPEIRLHYRWSKLATRSVLAEMETISRLQPDPLTLDLPPLPPHEIDGTYAVLRPPFLRMDYPAPAREPLPEYMREASETLRGRGYKVVTLGTFVPGMEEPNGEVAADVRYEYGEIPLLRAVALVAHAAMVVTSPCWMIPAAVAAGTPLLAIAGGIGGRNNPAALVDARLGANVQWIMPDDYCMCRVRDHDCPRTISGFTNKLHGALGALAYARAA